MSITRICGILLLIFLVGGSGREGIAASLTDNGNGTVTDSATGLVWQQGEGGSMTWDNAITYCEGLSLGGQSDWRLPNVKELEFLTDDSRYYPAIDNTYFPNAISYYYWSTTNASPAYFAWIVDFREGSVFDAGNKSEFFYVRCVRGGQPGSLGSLSISSASPTTAITGTSQNYTITGSNLPANLVATIEGTDVGAHGYCSNVSGSGNSVVINCFAQVAGHKRLYMTNVAGGTAIPGSENIYVDVATMSVSSASPAVAITGTSQDYTITGSNLPANLVATIEGTEVGAHGYCTNVSGSGSSVIINCFAQVAGHKRLYMTNVSGGAAIPGSENIYVDVANLNMAATSVSPTAAITGTSQNYTITGSNLPANLVATIEGTDVGAHGYCSNVSGAGNSVVINCFAQVAGHKRLFLTNVAGGAAIPGSESIYVDVATMSVSSASPTTAITGTSQNYTIAGSNLPANLVATIEGTEVGAHGYCTNVSGSGSSVITNCFAQVAGHKRLYMTNVSGGAVIPGSENIYVDVANLNMAATSVSPTVAITGTSQNYTIAGSNLPANLVATIEGTDVGAHGYCSNVSGSGNSVVINCFSQVAGHKRLYMTNVAGGVAIPGSENIYVDVSDAASLTIAISAMNNKKLGGAFVLDADITITDGTSQTLYKTIYLEKAGSNVAKAVVPYLYVPESNLKYSLVRPDWTDMSGNPVYNWSDVFTSSTPVSFKIIAEKIDGTLLASQAFNLSYQSTLSAGISSNTTFPAAGTAITPQFTANASGGSGGYSYKWNSNTALTSSTFSPSYNFGVGGEQVSLAVADSSGNVTYAKTIAVIYNNDTMGDPADTGGGSMLVNNVDVVSGNLHLSWSDLNVSAKGLPVSMNRAYNSDPTTASAGKWALNNFFQKASRPSVNNDRTLYIKEADGRTYTYFKDFDGRWYPANPALFDMVIEAQDGTIVRYAKGGLIYTYSSLDSSNYGNLVSIADRDGNTTTFTYEFVPGSLVNKRPAKITDSVGRDYPFSYSGSTITFADFTGRNVQYTLSNSNVAAFKDVRGNVTTYGYDAAGKLASITDPRNNTALTVTYDGNNRVATVTDAVGNQTSFSYNTADANNLYTVVTSPDNNNRIYRYNKLGIITQYIDALGNTVQKTFDSISNNKRLAESGLVKGSTNALNKSTSFGYSNDGRGNKAVSTNTLNQVTSFGNKTELDYPTAKPNLNVMASFTTPKNNSYAFTHKVSGNIESVKTPITANPATQFSYLAGGLLQTVTDPNSRSTTYAYYANGTVNSVTDAKNLVTSYSYDALGRVDTSTDRRGIVSKYTYDAAGNVLTAVSAYGTPRAATVTNTYDANGNLLTVTDARGNTRTITYTKNNQMATESFTAGGTTYTRSYTYDALGRLWKTTNENGNMSQVTFDAAGRKTTDISPLPGVSTIYTYDANSNVLTTTDAEGHVTTNSYDELDRVKTVTDHLGNKVEYFYDAEGNREKVKDPKGQYTYYAYYPDGKLQAVTDANGGITTATYDPAGNLKTVSGPASGNVVTYSYDELNRMISMKDAGNREWTFSYDANGNLLSQVVPGLGTTSFQYDELSRMTRVTYPDNSTVQYGYDLNGNRTSMVDSSGSTSYSYDEANRLTSVTDPFGKVVGYTYDGVGNVKRIVYPGSKNLNYAYDAGERLASVANWLGSSTSYTYNKVHQLTRIVNGNSTRTNFVYDNANRLTTLQNLKGSGAVISSHNYTLDANGNISQANVTLPLEPQFGSSSTNLAFDAANRIITSGSTSFSHDLAGRIVSENTGVATKNYSYNFRDLLTAISGSGDSYSYVYNGDGNRIAMSKNGAQTRYVLDLNTDLPDVLAETDGAGVVKSYYTYGNGLISKIDAVSSAESWFHFDPTGNTLALTDASQNVTDSYAYTPYGETSVQGTSWNPFRYSGKHGVMDDGNGLNYMRARYYKPGIARFLSLDAVWGGVGSPKSLNRYAYVKGDPIWGVDPSGNTEVFNNNKKNIPTKKKHRNLLSKRKEKEFRQKMKEAAIKDHYANVEIYGEVQIDPKYRYDSYQYDLSSSDLKVINNSLKYSSAVGKILSSKSDQSGEILKTFMAGIKNVKSIVGAQQKIESILEYQRSLDPTMDINTQNTFILLRTMEVFWQDILTPFTFGGKLVKVGTFTDANVISYSQGGSSPGETKEDNDICNGPHDNNDSEGIFCFGQR